MNEFAPKWSNPKMTQAQVKAYIANMKKAQAIAQQKLKEEENNIEEKLKEKEELAKLEEKLENL